MQHSNEPSCWRAALLTFGVIAGLMLIIALVSADGSAVAIG